jgi:FkbM family methyltransferase
MEEKIISYAQNFEDIMLYRALKHIKSGFYIDIGAADPIGESVSKLFYDKGWRGINIEPNKTNFDKILSNRPEDININSAIGDLNGKDIDFFEYISPGYYNNGSLDVKHAELTKKYGFEINKYKVSVLTLDDIFNTYKVNTVHWLKIDVEGNEYNVLKGWNLDIMPWIVVIEAIGTYSFEQIHDKWEFILLNKGYKFVYSDLVNRYYLHDKQIGLKKFFNYGPNCLDNFYIPLSSTYIDPECLNDYGHEDIQNERLKHEIIKYKREIEQIYSSRSWKITKPLRVIKNFLSRLFVR